MSARMMRGVGGTIQEGSSALTSDLETTSFVDSEDDRASRYVLLSIIDFLITPWIGSLACNVSIFTYSYAVGDLDPWFNLLTANYPLCF